MLIRLADIKLLSDDFSIALIKHRPEWMEEMHIESDVDVSVDSIEGKTFGLSYIMNGFLQGYDLLESGDFLFRIDFIQKSKYK